METWRKALATIAPLTAAIYTPVVLLLVLLALGVLAVTGTAVREKHLVARQNDRVGIRRRPDPCLH